MELLFAIISFFAGAVIDRAYLNRGLDDERCKSVKSQIDTIVGHFHERFSPSPEKRQNASTLFDYEMMSLLDDTTLVPVIGSRAFDGEYIRNLTEIYKASQVDAAAATPDERRALLSRVDKHAVDLKKVISSSKKQFRVRGRS